MVDHTEEKVITPDEFLKEIREFSLTMNEECPEGHRRDPASGRCLPLGSYDHTQDSRSLNVDYGPEWRGTASEETQETALLDANEMDEPESCSEGTTFSFIQRKCIPLEEAEIEDNEEFARDEEGNPIEEEVEEAAAPGSGGHKEITLMQPEGRRDTVNHECPPKMIFDYKLRKCIPLNKDSLMASMNSLVEKISVEPEEASEKAFLATPAGRERLSEALIHLVADCFAMTVKGYNFHWNIVAPIFEDLHEMFNEDYDALLCQADLIAERVRAMGFSVPASLSDFRRLSSISDQHQALEARQMVEEWLADHEHMAADTRAVQKVAEEVGDNTTLAMLDDKILFHQKRAWMFRSVLSGSPDPLLLGEPPEEGMEETYAKAAKITTKQRKGLPDSAFGVPGKRKFPLDTCGRVRNAMARFNQAKGLTAGEKATLRRKIMSRAKACGIEVRNFAKATTDAEFAEVTAELIRQVVVPKAQSDESRLAAYRAESQGRGPCPPGMMWDKKAKKCAKMAGFVSSLRDDANHSEIISKDPEGRKDTVGFQCPEGWFFDFGVRRCLPLDPAAKEKALEEEAVNAKPQNRDLAPRPKGKPARLPQDCPKGEIWDADLEKCKPLDSRKKTKSAEEEDAQDAKSGPANGPGKNKDSKGCGPGEFFNPVSKKCMPRKGAFTGKSAEEQAQAVPGNREGLTKPPAGKVQHPTDCPPNTAWDAKNKICRPIDSMDKDRPSGSSPQAPRSVASLSTAQLVKQLDGMIREQADSREKSRVAAKDLPNAAFPPSLVGSTRRVFMHHTPDVEDPYDNETVDVARLRNALARSLHGSAGEDFQPQAFQDGIDHLLYHARALVGSLNSKKE